MAAGVVGADVDASGAAASLAGGRGPGFKRCREKQGKTSAVDASCLSDPAREQVVVAAGQEADAVLFRAQRKAFREGFLLLRGSLNGGVGRIPFEVVHHLPVG